MRSREHGVEAAAADAEPLRKDFARGMEGRQGPLLGSPESTLPCHEF